MEVREAGPVSFGTIVSQGNTLISELKDTVELLRKFNTSEPVSDLERELGSAYLQSLRSAYEEFIRLAKRRFGTELGEGRR